MLRTADVAFGEKLRQRRLQLGLTQVQVAERLARYGNPTGHQGYVTDVERGRFLPKEATRHAFARALELSDKEMEALWTEAKLEELGLSDPAFTLMFKDIPNMTPEEKQSILRVYMEEIIPARQRRRRG